MFKSAGQFFCLTWSLLRESQTPSQPYKHEMLQTNGNAKLLFFGWFWVSHNKTGSNTIAYAITNNTVNSL